MRRLFNFILNLFRRKSQAPATTHAETPVVVTPPSSSPDDGGVMSNIKEGIITGATNGEILMIQKAIEFNRKIIASPYFKEEVLKANFSNTNGLSNQQIYELYINTQITVNVDLFDGNWKQNHVWHTMGYEDPNDDFVHANRYFIQDALTMGSLILHEISHEPLGFHHSSASDTASVPYTMNRIFDIVAKKLGLI